MKEEKSCDDTKKKNYVSRFSSRNYANTKTKKFVKKKQLIFQFVFHFVFYSYFSTDYKVVNNGNL